MNILHLPFSRIGSKIFTFLAAITILQNVAYSAPKVISSCKSGLQQTLAAEKDFIKDIFAAKKGWKISYEVTSEIFNDQAKQYQEHVSRGELIAGEHVRYKKTNNNEVFADAHDIFTVSFGSKSIMHTYSDPREMKVKDDLFSEVMHDTLFKLMQVVNCDKVKMWKKDVVYYTLTSDLPRSPYSKIIIYTDSATKFILKIYVQMNLNYQREVKAYSFTILEKKQINIDPTWEHLYDKFINSSGKLKQPYNNFVLEEPTKDEQKRKQEEIQKEKHKDFRPMKK